MSKKQALVKCYELAKKYSETESWMVEDELSDLASKFDIAVCFGEDYVSVEDEMWRLS